MIEAKSKVCVIGAGVSGLACCAVFAKHNIEFDCYEKDNDVGGIWNYKDTVDRVSVYKNCTLNHSNQVMGYPFLPIPELTGDYAHNKQYFSYLSQVAEKLELRDKISFNTAVQNVQRSENGWLVEIEGEGTKTYTHVVVCAGFYSSGYVPQEYVENYTGEYIHSMNYRRPESYSDKSVLIVGSGSSAIQIASDLTNIADSVNLSARKMPYILPKYLFGKPYIKSFPAWLRRWFSLSWQSWFADKVIRLSNGAQERYGIPAPQEPVLNGRLPISSDIFDKASTEMVTFRPGIKSVKGKLVSFDDGEKAEYDSIIFATGYRLNLPFLKTADGTFDVNENYKFVSSIKQPSLFFCGFLQPVGPVPPLVTAQANWIAQVINGQKELPSEGEQFSYMRKLKEKLNEQFNGDFNGRILLTDYLTLLSE